ncbi:MAG: Oxidoreductase, zinc-binding dehydrogenase family [Geminicoccaceae bacterium]|nr:Oxidoreductase, zinc-binding dehydrogenase family [Geminicoccaceae bacterium]
MLAVWYERNGEAAEVLQFGELETPTPATGEVRVRLAASGINPIDVKRRRGARGQMIKDPLVVPGFDGAGVIDAVGDGVAASRIGERVWVYEGQWQRPRGTAAEFVTVPVERTVALPAGTSFVEGACLGIPALTAHREVFADGPVDGQTVLVTGGAGAVGAYAIQFAKFGGARVLTTVSSDRKAEIGADAGADYVFNYKAENVAQRIADLPGGGGVDRIVEVEVGGNLPQSLEILKPNGVIAGYASDAVLEPKLPFYPLAYKSATMRFILVFMMPEAAKQQGVHDITRWLAAGELRHYVASRLPLAEAVAAHEALEKGPIGNVVLEIAPAA